MVVEFSKFKKKSNQGNLFVMGNLPTVEESDRSRFYEESVPQPQPAAGHYHMQQVQEEAESSMPLATPSGGTESEYREPMHLPFSQPNATPDMMQARQAPVHRTYQRTQANRPVSYQVFSETRLGSNYLVDRDDAFRFFESNFLPTFRALQETYLYGIFEQKADDDEDSSVLQFVFFCDQPDLINPGLWVNQLVGKFELAVAKGGVSCFLGERRILPTHSIGGSIGPKYSNSSGSIAGFFVDQNQKHYLLTCRHVIDCKGPTSTTMMQPSPNDAKGDLGVAENASLGLEPLRALAEKPIGNYVVGMDESEDVKKKYYDFAWVELEEAQIEKCHNAFVRQSGDILKVITIADALDYVDQKVWTVGRTNGDRIGCIIKHHQRGRIRYTRFDIKEDFCIQTRVDHGDSGGLVCSSDGCALGMIWGGDDEHHQYGFFVPMTLILEDTEGKFGLKMSLLDQ